MNNDFLKECEGVIVFAREEFAKIRTGRANASLVQDLRVDAYGSLTPLNQLATISVPEPRTIAISPWDKQVLASIEKAVRNSDVGITPLNDGNTIRLILPTLNEETRKDLVKKVNVKAEEARIRVRTIRENYLRGVDSKEESGEISEDEKFSQRKDIQKYVDEYNQKIESIRSEKEKEVMTV
ncbi:MAG: ribosome recycling factor [Candidatus Moraniibacteriota bacterium]|nr:MAG: ribosome recycling factor [Candidatus Moranbacteria bacterium]